MSILSFMKTPKSLFQRNTKPKKKNAIYFEKTQSKRISRRSEPLQPSSAIKAQKKTNSKDTLPRPIKKTTRVKKIVKKVVKKVFSLKKKPLKILPSTLSIGFIRLEKYMAQSGMASRREAKDFIHRGIVTVNRQVIKNPGHGINPEKDSVSFVKGTMIIPEVILLYKPRGVETMKTSPENHDIHDRFPQFSHLAPIGRLDKDSEGLIILSNDGVLAKKMTAENSTIEKEYRVTVREDVFPVLLQKMERGIILDKIITKPCITKKISTHEFSITLTEGRKHQVRRMANACKLTVTRLVRIRIGALTIGKMTAGNFKKIPNSLTQEMKK